MKGCLLETRRGGQKGKGREKRGEREREREVSLSRGWKLELYSLLSIFGTFLPSPRRNPALAPSYAPSLTPLPPSPPPLTIFSSYVPRLRDVASSQAL